MQRWRRDHFVVWGRTKNRPRRAAPPPAKQKKRALGLICPPVRRTHGKKGTNESCRVWTKKVSLPPCVRCFRASASVCGQKKRQKPPPVSLRTKNPHKKSKEREGAASQCVDSRARSWTAYKKRWRMEGGGKAARRAAGAENERKKMKNTRSFWEHKHGDKKKTQHQTLKRKHGNDRAKGWR